MSFSWSEIFGRFGDERPPWIDEEVRSCWYSVWRDARRRLKRGLPFPLKSRQLGRGMRYEVAKIAIPMLVARGEVQGRKSERWRDVRWDGRPRDGDRLIVRARIDSAKMTDPGELVMLTRDEPLHGPKHPLPVVAKIYFLNEQHELPRTISPVDQQRIDAGEAATCPRCARVIAIRNARGGDGSARRFVRHGSRISACSGSGMFAPGWGVAS